MFWRRRPSEGAAISKILPYVLSAARAGQQSGVPQAPTPDFKPDFPYQCTSASVGRPRGRHPVSSARVAAGHDDFKGRDMNRLPTRGGARKNSNDFFRRSACRLGGEYAFKSGGPLDRRANQPHRKRIDTIFRASSPDSGGFGAFTGRGPIADIFRRSSSHLGGQYAFKNGGNDAQRKSTLFLGSRSRDRGCPRPPPQIRTGGITAYGSYPGTWRQSACLDTGAGSSEQVTSDRRTS